MSTMVCSKVVGEYTSIICLQIDALVKNVKYFTALFMVYSDVVGNVLLLIFIFSFSTKASDRIRRQRQVINPFTVIG